VTTALSKVMELPPVDAGLRRLVMVSFSVWAVSVSVGDA
jgi:hypothetical protein